MNLSYQEIISLAPNAAAAKRGEQLSNPGKWSQTGMGGQAIWGACKGSGKNPYQTVIDLNGPAFKCSCPSRQFPCKHGIGLLLLKNAQSNLFPDQAPPEWASAWLARRRETSEKKEETPKKAAAQNTPSRAKQNQEKRERKVGSGLPDLQQWIEDLVFQGFAQMDRSSYQLWENQAARMTDCQAPGLASRIRAIPGLLHQDDWVEKCLNELAGLNLLIQGYQQRNELPEGLRDSLFQQIGFPVKKEELVEREGLQDNWTVLAVEYGENNGLRSQKAWIAGANSKRFAFLLDFAFGGAGFTHQFLTGSHFIAELVYYPGSFEHRAVAKSIEFLPPILGPIPTYGNMKNFLLDQADMMERNPLLSELPLCLHKLRVGMEKGKAFLVDGMQQVIPLKNQESTWKILAISGGKESRIFGLWDGMSFMPLSLLQEDRLISLAQNEANNPSSRNR